MFVLITYDVNTETREGRKRLSSVAKECKNYGHRVQSSVFECVLTEVQVVQLRDRISSIIDKKTDSVRFYFIGKNWKQHIEHIGVETGLDVTETLII